MKELKAYIRKSRVNRTVERLGAIGAPGITVVEIHPIGYGYEPNYFEPEYSDAFKRYNYLEIVKVDIVCAERDVDRLTAAIREENTTGSPGDGWIFVSDVVAALRIRDGKEGEEALAAARR